MWADRSANAGTRDGTGGAGLAGLLTAGYTHAMHVGAIVLEIRLPGCRSLKEKRGRLKPLLAALQREFSVSAAEVELMDRHEDAVIGIVAVSNDGRHVERWLSKIPGWVERQRPDMTVVDYQYHAL